MTSNLTLSSLESTDIKDIVDAFKSIGWNKPISLFKAYLKDQSEGIRSVIVAKVNGEFCGYVTLKFKSQYPYFTQNNIPEISDLNVLPEYQNAGIGTKLIIACEKLAHERGCRIVGIGVGMTRDYGNAQRLYVKHGYIPDGNGLHYKNQPLRYGDKVSVDDDLVLYFTKWLSNK